MQHEYLPPCLLRSHCVYQLTGKRKQNVNQMQRFRSPLFAGLVPNFSKPIVCTHSERRGRYCVVSHVNIGRSGTLAYNSVRWRAIRLFNSLQKFIRCTTSCSVYDFKHILDSYLMNIVDYPCVPGFNNSPDGGDCNKMEDTL